MIYRLLMLITIFTGLAACAPVTINGDLVSDQGDKLGRAEMVASELRGLHKYSVRAELPDETVFTGQMKYGEKSVTLFDNNGVSMKCDFDLDNPAKAFQGGGQGRCTTSDGQTLKVKF